MQFDRVESMMHVAFAFRPMTLPKPSNRSLPAAFVKIHCDGFLASFLSTLAIMGAVEAYRSGGSVGDFGEDLDSLYPGGPFDPLGLADDPDTFAELKVKEIKNGRLAMVAMLGFYVQPLVTKQAPLDHGVACIPFAEAMFDGMRLLCGWIVQ